MKRLLFLISTLVLLGSGTVICAPGFDVNDTVFLFPLDAKKKPYPDLSLKGLANKPNFVYREQLDQLLNESKKHRIKAPAGVDMSRLLDWKIVAYRYDPCSPDTRGPESSDCMQELRVVAQPINASGPLDTALHVIYGLGRGEPRADNPVLKDLVAMKADLIKRTKINKEGKPLGLHPDLKLAVKNVGKGYATPIIDFLAKHALPTRVKKLTMMGLKDGRATAWTFFGGNIVDGRFVVSGIGNLPQNDNRRIDFDLDSADRLFFPVPVQTLMSTYGFFHREAINEGDIDIYRRNIHAIENPRLTNRNTVDCLSCHTATTVRLNANTFVPRFVDGKTMALPLGITAFPEAGLLQKHIRHWNLRALGYFGTQATLSMRTVHEAAQVANRLNRILGLKNPGPDCRAKRMDVLSCFETNLPSPSMSAEQIRGKCMAMCKPQP